MTHSQNTYTRRSCLQAGLVGGLGLALSDNLKLQAEGKVQNARADSVLFLNLAGGPSHLDTLDVKPEGPQETRGEFQPIQSKIPGLVVCEHLPKFAGIADKFALIRGIHHSAGAHPQGQSYISTGNRPTPAVIYPSLGSVIGKQRPTDPDLPPYIAVPNTEWNAGYLGDAFAPFKTNTVPKPGEAFQVRGISLPEGVTVENVRRREQLLAKIDQTFRNVETNSPLLEALDTFSERAYEMITSARAQSAFDVSKEPKSVQFRFTADELNQSLLLACRLLEFGVRFVTVTNAGWDTHLDNFKGHQRLLGPLDHGLKALYETLSSKGLLERTLVVVMGEFGRTPKINSNIGRDHWPRANWCLLTGAGVKNGLLLGGTDAEGAGADDATDIEPDDIAATIYHALGIDPKTEFHTRTGRPVMLVPEGEVLEGVFA